MEVTNSSQETNWSCPTCTLINNIDIDECIACGTSKSGSTENSTAVWTCRFCTTYNQVSNTICISCGIPMDSELRNNDLPVLDEIDELGQMMSTEDSTSSDDLLRLLFTNFTRNMTPREKAENIAFNYNPCRCSTCKIRAIRNIIRLNQTAITDEQKELSAIMINEIMPALINSSFTSDNPILQLLNSDNMETLEEVLDRSLAEYEGNQIPATKEEISGLKTLDCNEAMDKKYHDQKCCVICMDDFDFKSKDTKIMEMPCNHIFHKDCLHKWLKESDASCPICKHRINKELNIIKKDDLDEQEDDDLDELQEDDDLDEQEDDDLDELQEDDDLDELQEEDDLEELEEDNLGLESDVKGPNLKLSD